MEQKAEELQETKKQLPALAQFKGLLSKISPEVKRRLPTGPNGEPLDDERMIAQAEELFGSTPGLQKCDQREVAQMVLRAFTLGLEVDPRLGRAYILPFKDKKGIPRPTLIVGYKGYLELAYRSRRVIDVEAAVVYEGDYFEYELGSSSRIRHRPLMTKDRSEQEVLYAYAVCHLVGGGKVMHVCDQSELDAARNRSPSRNAYTSPWKTDYAAMCQKTAIRRLASKIPQAPDVQEVASIEGRAEQDIVDVEAVDVPASALAGAVELHLPTSEEES